MKSGRSTEVNATAGTRTPIVASTPDLFDFAPVPLGYWPSGSSLEGRFLDRLLKGAEMTAGDWRVPGESAGASPQAQEPERPVDPLIMPPPAAKGRRSPRSQPAGV